MLEHGTVVQGRYRVVKLLGQGGMGAVYRAWDLRLKVPVALKELRPQPGLDTETLDGLRDQFAQEASVLARMNHPNLVRVTDYFDENGNVYLVMDFVDGRSLADVIVQDGAQSESQVVEWARQLLEALMYCHAQGVVHRDIKPQNIVLRQDGSVVLVDFGLVKLWDPNDPRTRTVMRGMGTPEYAPPEQYGAATDHTGPPSDIYSVGATLYHLLTGQAPATATERMAMPESFVPLERLAPEVSPRIQRLIMKALELSVGERWQTASQMLSVLVSGPLPSFPDGASQAVGAPSARHTPQTVRADAFASLSAQPAIVPGDASSQSPPASRTPVAKRSKGFWIAMVGGVFICLAIGCLGIYFGLPMAQEWLGISTSTVPSTTEVQVQDPDPSSSDEAASAAFSLTVDNRSPDEICYVYISPSASENWGNDWLSADQVIAPGDRFTFDVEAGSHDVRLERCDEVVVGTAWSVDAGRTLTVGDTEAQVGLLLSNESASDVCYLYISGSFQDDWGQDWLGYGEVLSPGAMRIFYVRAGTYDLQVMDCNGVVLTEAYEVDMSEDLTWTLHD